MKKKGLLLLIIAIFIVIISTVIVFAAESKNQKILTGEKINIGEGNSSNIKAQSSLQKEFSNNEIYSIADGFLTNQVMNVSKTDINKADISYYTNAIYSKDVVRLSDDNFTLEIDKNNGEIITYENKKQNFIKCELDKDEILLKANEIFNNLDIKDKDNYQLIYLEEFDEEIWRVGFAKKYEDNLINNGESVKFSFAPQTKEIVTLAINAKKYDNNSILITQEEALKIAKKAVSDNIKDFKITTKIEIVVPNYRYYENDLESGQIYKEINVMRKAYVCEFADEFKTQVYVDCSTGEIIGGTEIL